MFDIDGTLTETMKVDEDCFVRSFLEVFGFTDIDTNWSAYPYVTNSGLLHEIYVSRMGYSPTALDISRFRQYFIELLVAASSQSPFTPVPGAGQLLSRLTESSTHRIALATGGWRDSARLKLANTGLCFDDYPAASADDALDRESIMRLSMQRAVEQYGETFDSTIYVGDGVWDAHACRTLGIPFIGIGSGAHAARLISEGAFCVFQDFSEEHLFLKSLDTATQRV